MKPRQFTEQNWVYLGGGEIEDLPCRRIRPGQILSVWELSPEERIAIAEGADIQLIILAEPIPPVSLAIYSQSKEIEGLARVQ